jgi:hypothetical protein
MSELRGSNPFSACVGPSGKISVDMGLYCNTIGPGPETPGSRIVSGFWERGYEVRHAEYELVVNRMFQPKLSFSEMHGSL